MFMVHHGHILASGYKRNEDWCARTEQELINIQIRRCKWGWIRHTPRKPISNVTRRQCKGRLHLERNQKVSPEQKEMAGKFHGPMLHREWKGISISILWHPSAAFYDFDWRHQFSSLPTKTKGKIPFFQTARIRRQARESTRGRTHHSWQPGSVECQRINIPWQQGIFIQKLRKTGLGLWQGSNQ